MNALIFFGAISGMPFLITSQDVQRVGYYNRSCVHGYPVKLGWNYDPGSSSLTSIQWRYKGSQIVLSFTQAIGPPGLPGPDFNGRANIYTDTETNAGLELTSAKYTDDISEYTIVVVLGTGIIPATDQHKTNLIIHEKVSDIEPMIDINSRGSIIISTLPSVIEVTQNFPIKADVSHISQFQPDEANITFVVSGRTIYCLSFPCDMNIALSVSDGSEQILSMHYTYGCYSQIYNTTLRIVEDPQPPGSVDLPAILPPVIKAAVTVTVILVVHFCLVKKALEKDTITALEQKKVIRDMWLSLGFAVCGACSFIFAITLGITSEKFDGDAWTTIIISNVVVYVCCITVTLIYGGVMTKKIKDKKTNAKQEIRSQELQQTPPNSESSTKQSKPKKSEYNF